MITVECDFCNCIEVRTTLNEASRLFNDVIPDAAVNRWLDIGKSFIVCSIECKERLFNGEQDKRGITREFSDDGNCLGAY